MPIKKGRKSTSSIQSGRKGSSIPSSTGQVSNMSTSGLSVSKSTQTEKNLRQNKKKGKLR